MKNLLYLLLFLASIQGFCQELLKGTTPKTYELSFEQNGKLKKATVQANGTVAEGLPTALKKDDTLKLVLEYKNQRNSYEKRKDTFLKEIAKNYDELKAKQPAFEYVFPTEFDFNAFRFGLMKESYFLPSLITTNALDYTNLIQYLSLFSITNPPLYLPNIPNNTFNFELSTFPNSPVATQTSTIIAGTPTFTKIELTHSLPTVDSLRFKLKQTTKADSAVLAHLKTTQKEYRQWGALQAEIGRINKKAAIYMPMIDKALDMDTLNGLNNRFDSTFYQALNSFEPYQDTLRMMVYDIVNTNRTWIKKWLWYSEGKITLNPFGVFDTAELEKQTTQALKNLNDQKTALNFYVTGSYRQDLSSFKDVENQLQEINANIDQLEKLKTILPEKQKSYNQWLTGLKQKSKVLYDGKLLGAKNERIYWMQHYNASQKFEKWEIKTSPIPKYLAAIDQNTVAIHNLTASQKDSFSVGNTEKITIESPTDVALKPVADVLTVALGNTAIGTLLAGFLPALRGINVKTSPLESTTEVVKLHKQQEGKNYMKLLSIEMDNLSYKDAQDSYDAFRIYQYRRSKALLEWLNAETLQMLSIPNIAPKDDTSPSFRTALHFPEKNLEDIGNAKIPYSVVVDKKVVATRTYQKHQLSRWLPVAALVYVPQSRATYIYDETTQQAILVKELDQFDAMVGIKYYPFGVSTGSNGKDKKLTKLEKCKGYGCRRGNSIWNHTYATFGLSVRQKVLKNYFLGIGTDFLPGVGVQGGFNVFAQKRYDIESGKIINEYEQFTHRCYVGLSLDLSLATNLVKFLIR